MRPRRRSASSASTWRRSPSRAAASSARCCSARSPAPACCRSARAQFEATIARGGVGVAASRRAFDAGFAQRRRGAADDADALGEPCRTAERQRPRRATASVPPAFRRPGAAPAWSEACRAPPAASSVRDPARRRARRARATAFPAAAQRIVLEGVRRLIDYQDLAYADLYLDRLARLAAPGAERRAAPARRDRAPPRALDVVRRTRSASPR